MVGRNLISYFKEKGVHAIPTDLSGWDVSGDLLDKDFVFGRLASLDFDAIIHMSEGDDGLAPRYQHFSDVWVKQGDQWRLRFQQATARRPID